MKPNKTSLSRLFKVSAKTVITPITPKRFWRVRDIHQRAACRKTLPRPSTVTTKHTVQTKGD